MSTKKQNKRSGPGFQDKSGRNFRILGLLYRCMITKRVSKQAARQDVVRNTPKAPKGIAAKTGTKLSRMIHS